MTTAHATHLLITLMACTFFAGCAHKQDTVEHTSRVLDPPIQQSQPATGEFTVHESSLKQDRIQANIEYKPYCYTLVLDQIEHNKVYGPRQKQKTGTTALGNTLTGIGTNVLNDLAGDTSDKILHEGRLQTYESDPTAAVIWGVLFLASGAEYVAYTTKHQGLHYRWTNIEERYQSPKHDCPPQETQPGGHLKIFHADTLLAQTDVPSGSIDLDLRTLPGLCDNPALLGKSVRILYTPHGSTDQLTLLENHSLDACIHAHTP